MVELLTNSLARIILILCLAWFCLWSYWWIDSLYGVPAEFSKPRIISIMYLGPDDSMIARGRLDQAKPGDIILLEVFVNHHKTCDLQISRTMRRLGANADFQIQFSVRSFVKDDVTTRTNYRMEVPPSMLPGKYLLINKLRYLCNPLDHLFPTYRQTVPLALEIIE